MRDKLRRAWQRDGLRKILSNISWMAGEQVFRLLVSLVVGAWVARYLGTNDFGLLNYATAYCGLFAVVATLGMNRAVVREIVDADGDSYKIRAIVGTATILRMVASVLILGLVIVSAIATNAGDVITTAIIAIGLLFAPFDTIDLYYQAKTSSKHAVSVRTILFTVTSALRLVAIFAGADLHVFAALTVVDRLFGAFGMIALLGGERHAVLPDVSAFKRMWAFLSTWSTSFCKVLLRDSWTEIVAGFSTVALMRLDIIMIEYYLPAHDVVIYSAAVKISELWYFIPTAIVASTFPKILKLRTADPAQYALRLQHLMVGLVGVGYAAVATVMIFSSLIVQIIYGAQYAEAAPILTVHIWGGILVSLGLASGSWIHAEKLLTISLKRTMMGAAANVALNFYLIPRYGGLGAAWATLIAYILCFLVYDLLDPKMRVVFRMKLKALLLRWKA